MRKPIRQGDVIFVPVDNVPPEATTRTSNVIAEGEATGHAHRAGPGLSIFGGDSPEFITGSGSVTHEEHNVASLDGNYRIIIQREYDDEREWTQVID